MSEPYATIVVRAYQAEATIARALASAVAQDPPAGELEILVVDDGSTDGSARVARTFGDRVRVISQANRGAIAAANAGFHAARGRYVVLLDADDELRPRLVSRLGAELDAEPSADFAYPDYDEEFQGRVRRVAPRDVFESLAGGVLFRRSWLDAAGSFREGVLFAEYDLYLRTLSSHRARHVAEPLFVYHRSSSSLTGDADRVERGLGQLLALHPDRADVLGRIRSYALERGPATLRAAQAGDADFLLALRNDPSVRAVSFQADPVAPDAHARWLAARLADTRTRLYVVETAGTRAGQVRVDLQGANAEISVAVDPRFRGRGIGRAAVAEACARTFAESAGVQAITARVLPGNDASRSLFTSAGFRDRGLAAWRGRDCHVLEITR